MKQKLTQASYIEYQASLFGAGGVALGLGALFPQYLQPIAFILILAGSVMHGWGMYRIHQRNG